MPKLRLILAVGALAGASIGVIGCGGGGPEPSIPSDDASSLLAKLQEIQSNVDNGSCFVASDRTDDLVSDIEALPSDVNSDVKRALENGANQLRILLTDPDQCEGRTTSTTTTTPSTESTESTTTERTQSTTSTTRTQTTTPTQTVPPPPTVTSGGIGPGGTD